jgi:hypothetical protein
MVKRQERLDFAHLKSMSCYSSRRAGRCAAWARSQAAEVTATVVAERLVAHLEKSGFVIMRKPISVGHP